MLSSLVFGFVVVALCIGGCKKELSSSGDVPKPEVIMSTGGKGAKTKVLRQSPGLKFEFKSEKTNRAFPKLQGLDTLTARLQELGKKKKSEKITTSTATFNASLYGTYYSCATDFPDYTGVKDYYLVNENTWVYTYLGTTSDSYAYFNVDKPLMYGGYRIWSEGPNGNGFSNAVYLGDAYTGVSLVSGILTFNNLAAYETLEARLEAAYETHQTFLDQFDSMSDDDADAAAINSGFDQFLPFKEFEAYFGLSSLRAQIQGEVDYWYTQSHTDLSGYPADNYRPYTYEEQTLMTSEGYIDVYGVTEGAITLPTLNNIFYWRDPVNPGANTCVFQAQEKDNENYESIREIKKKVYIAQNDITSKTSWVANIQTLKKQALLNRYYPSLQKQRVRVHGNYYNSSCAFQAAFDSGLTNSTLRKRYSQRTRYALGIKNLTSKSNEFALEGVIGSNSYTLTYTH